jgi:hypothetical protein
VDASQFSLLSALIFTLVAVLQLVRAMRRWPVTVGAISVPLWASWVACVVAVILAWLGFSAYKAENAQPCRHWHFRKCGGPDRSAKLP